MTMSLFISKCPHCQSDLPLQDDWIGMVIECPECSKKFSVVKDIPKLRNKETWQREQLQKKRVVFAIATVPLSVIVFLVVLTIGLTKKSIRDAKLDHRIEALSETFTKQQAIHQYLGLTDGMLLNWCKYEKKKNTFWSALRGINDSEIERLLKDSDNAIKKSNEWLNSYYKKKE